MVWDGEGERLGTGGRGKVGLVVVGGACQLTCYEATVKMVWVGEGARWGGIGTVGRAGGGRRAQAGTGCCAFGTSLPSPGACCADSAAHSRHTLIAPSTLKVCPLTHCLYILRWASPLTWRLLCVRLDAPDVMRGGAL
jgi:hypothetical protein